MHILNGNPEREAAAVSSWFDVANGLGGDHKKIIKPVLGKYDEIREKKFPRQMEFSTL